MKEIKDAHKNGITNIKYFSDENNKKEYLLTVSRCDRNIKLWDLKNYNKIFDIIAYGNGCINSVWYLKDRSYNYILTSNNHYECIKVFNLKGNMIKKIEDSYDKVYFIDVFYDKKNNNNYIVTGNEGYLKSYDYNNNKLYYRYNDKHNKKNIFFYAAIMNEIENEIKLIV